MSPKITRVTPPAALTFPVTIEECFFEHGQTLSKGDKLYIVADQAGKRILMRAPRDGVVAEGPVPAGSTLPQGMPVLGMHPPAADADPAEAPAASPPPSAPPKAKAQPKRDPQPQPAPQQPRQPAQQTPSPSAQNPTPRHILAAVELEREKSPSAFMRRMWTADSPDTQWGGAAPVLKLIGLFAAIVLVANLLFRMAVPDLDLEQMIPFGIASALVAAVLTLRAARTWRHRPSPTGLVLPMIALVSGSAMLGMTPDDEINRATGFRAEDLTRMLRTPGASITTATAATRPAQQSQPKPQPKPKPKPAPPIPVIPTEEDPSVAGATPTSDTASSGSRSWAAQNANDPSGAFTCRLRLFQHCENAHIATGKKWTVFQRITTGLPADLCDNGTTSFGYSIPTGNYNYDDDFPPNFRGEALSLMKRFKADLQQNFPDCEVAQWRRAALWIVPPGPGQKEQKCYATPQPGGSYVCLHN